MAVMAIFPPFPHLFPVGGITLHGNAMQLLPNTIDFEGGCALCTVTRDTWRCVWRRDMCMGAHIYIDNSIASSLGSDKEAVELCFL
jgi:hypothetical protein